MAEIINHNPEDNPRLNEIYELLLLAGYFRIRIASLKAFDKVTGGIAWCITSSNFQIQIQYNDEMQIGQKIKVSETICHALKQMKCPYNLQPFQLQGLDVNSLYLIVQWLVKFVYETREQRHKYDRQLSLLLGKGITKLCQKGNSGKVERNVIKRSRINKAISQISFSHPVRVYSALLECKDASGAKMYHKLLNIITKKKKKTKEGQKKDKNNEIIGYLQDEGDEQVNPAMNQFGDVDNFSLQRLQKIIQENKQNLEEGLKEEYIQGPSQEDERVKNDKTGDSEQNEGKGVKKGEKRVQDRQNQKIIKSGKKENEKVGQKILAIESQISSYANIEEKLEKELEDIKQKHEKAKQKALLEIEKNKQYKSVGKEIQSNLKDKKELVNNKLQKLVEKRISLKNKKGEIKKRAKNRIQQLNKEKQLVEISIPQIDEEAFGEMMREAEEKKEIYDRKYEELTLVNQDLAILQRKTQNITSPAEIVQYHQRFIELFEAINILIEEKRSMYNEIANIEASKKMINNYLQILKNSKEGYLNIKKKNELRELVDDMKDILKGLQENMNNSNITLEKIKGKRESVYAELLDLIKMERQYLQLLRDLKIEYENAAIYYK